MRVVSLGRYRTPTQSFLIFIIVRLSGSFSASIRVCIYLINVHHMVMTAVEKINESIERVDAMLERDFMTQPVREILTEIKGLLEGAKADLS